MISHNGHSRAVTVGTDHAYEADDWRARAACFRHDPELWYPVGTPPTDSPVWDEPRGICDICPVRVACLADAIEHEDVWGMRAGMTPGELDELMHFRKCKDCDQRAAEDHDRCADCQRALWREYKRTSTPIRECPGCNVVRRIQAHGLCRVCLRAQGVAS